ncbi:ATP-binding protein [Rappaport israeli]|uniref:ATP-binding protein n=1 Tax=Rappaport israeli TaxID=1839807 RepID=UPI0038CD3862
MKNAIEATETQANPTIILTTQNQPHQILLTIEDNGTGFIDLNKDPFEPYVTGKKKGTGLGLAIVKKIILEHHGNIQAGHSTTLEGAKISLTLPLNPPT